MIRYLLPAIALLGFTSPAIADDDMFERTVSVTAEGEVKAAPDKVDIYLSLNEEAPNLEEARKLVDQQLKSLYAIAEGMDIAKKDLETTYSSVQPQYRYEERKKVFQGYRVTHNVTVTLRDVEKLAIFTDKVLNAKIDEINNTRFGLEKQEEFKEEAMKKAMVKARRKAEVLAAAAGAKLGKALTISEGTQIVAPQPLFKGRAMMMAASADAVMESDAPPSGEIELRTNVSVMYQLTD